MPVGDGLGRYVLWSTSSFGVAVSPTSTASNQPKIAP